MTQEDIIKLAREAGLAEGIADGLNGEWKAEREFLERFAALVAAAEREACAKLCLEEANEAYHQEAFYLPRGNQGLLRIAEGAKRCAEAIRARGEQ
jgi:hypothetical protein